ncbi:hypothetical protein TNCT_459801 [Trichonephila clavata]|uniref:Uncharacterized protein n=1 Tax=Trichonephila clavata TaxID=2740835 RepID=A0A8X6FZK5_TRICU|nr:hypothetical protein TNCT_459801 [Trichonephila clavata]
MRNVRVQIPHSNSDAFLRGHLLFLDIGRFQIGMETTRKGSSRDGGVAQGRAFASHAKCPGSNPAPHELLTRFLRGHLLFLDTWTLPDWNGDH